MRWAQTLIAVTALSTAAPATAELDLNRAEVTHLSDGLTVIMLEDNSFPVVSVQMLYKSGSAAETTGKTGLAHFMEHLAFRGSQNFPNESATELIYDAGGEWHGYTAFDQTTYFATMPKDGLDLLLRIEADRMARTVIDPASMEAERGAVITELHSYENDPASVLQDAVARTAIQAHPYGSPMAGYVSDVEHLTADDARAYYAGHYAPGNAVLAIVGDFVPAEAHALLARDFADVPARPVAHPQYTLELPQTRTTEDRAVRRHRPAIFPARLPFACGVERGFPGLHGAPADPVRRSGGQSPPERLVGCAVGQGIIAVRGGRRRRYLPAADARPVLVHDQRIDRPLCRSRCARTRVEKAYHHNSGSAEDRTAPR